MSLGFRLSVAANVALATAAIVIWVRQQPPPPVAAPSLQPSTAPQPMVAPTAAVVSPKVHTVEGPRLTHETVERFEKAGVSTAILADIVRLDFDHRWNRRIAELENKYAPRQPPQREYIALRRQHDDAQIRELKAALGEDGYLAWDKADTLRKLNFEEVPMNAAESDQAYRLQKQLDGKIRDMQMAMEDGDTDVSDMGTLQMQAEQAYEKQLQNLLGEQRYNQLKGYTTAVVDGYMMFNELNLTAEQTNALKAAASEYQSRQAELAKQLADKPVDAATLAAQLKALNDARDAKFRDTVGDAYESLSRENDPTYQTLTQFAPAWSLNGAELEPVYKTLKAYETGVDELRQAAQMRELAGQAADWKTINAAIEQSRQQTEAALQNLIGPDGVSRLARNGLLSPLGSDRNAPHGRG